MSLRTKTALTVRQPWASLLLAGVKKYEVRPWSPGETRYVLLHAGGKAVGLKEDRAEPLYCRALRRAEIEDEPSWPLGAFIGIVEIKRMWEPGNHPRSMSAINRYLCGETSEMYLWEVGRRWEFTKPIDCDGWLKLWQPSPATLRKLMKARLRSA